jgi:hypothetical protein
MKGAKIFNVTLAAALLLSAVLGVVAIFVWPSGVVDAPVFARFLVGFGATGLFAAVLLSLMMPFIGFRSSRKFRNRIDKEGEN